ncbi:hypothetical protein L195_g026457, partial [Trifolium pratense]
TQDLHSHTTLVYLHLKPRFLHQSLKPVYPLCLPPCNRVFLAPPLQADVEYYYHRLSRPMSSIIPPPLQADVEYYYYRLSRPMSNVEYSYHRLSKLTNPLWFATCDYECSRTLIAFLLINENLSRQTTIAPPLRTILLEVTRFLTMETFELATTITLWPRLGPIFLSFHFAFVLASTLRHIQAFRTIINPQVSQLCQLLGSQR